MTPLRWLLAVTAPLALAVGLVAVACSNSGTVLDAGIEAAVEGGTGDERAGDARADGDTSSPGHPVLVSLVVSSKADGGAGVALYPTFSPEVTDYSVRCPASKNALTVSMTASNGSRSLLLQPVTSPTLPTQTLSVDVAENVAIVAAATDGKSTTEYWVRCLPPDMPELLWTLHPEAGAPTPGYYLVGNLYPTKGANGYALVLDSRGVPVWYARAPEKLGAATVNALKPEAVTFYPFSPTTVSTFELRFLSPLALSDLGPVDVEMNLHELVLLPDGAYLALADPLAFGVDLTGLSAELPDGGEGALGPGSTIQDCEIVEFAPSGTVISTWFATQHFVPAEDSTFPTLAFAGATAPDGGAVYDVFHCNSIDVDPANGNWLVSARNMDSVFYVDIVSRAVLWKIGGKSASLDRATYVSAKDPFYRQHDARLQPGWAVGCNGGTGQVSVFDDEFDRKNPARAVVYDVVVGGDGGTPPPEGGCPEAGASGTATVAWQYPGTTSIPLAGSFRILSDGSRIIGWGQGGPPRLVFSEVDLSGNDLLDFGYGDSEPSYRAIKVPLSTFDIGVLRNTAGLP